MKLQDFKLHSAPKLFRAPKASPLGLNVSEPKKVTGSLNFAEIIKKINHKLEYI